MMITLYIKNMVCNRCIMVVKNELEKLGIKPCAISLGEVQLDEAINETEIKTISLVLEKFGFALLDDKKSRIIERIKNIIVELTHYQDEQPKTNLSDILSNDLKHDYNYLSNLFSKIEGITIEKYYIAQKIERIKELLVDDELSLSEIAFKLNYSSVAYLSNQFKKVTGMTPSYFKNIQSGKRRSLDEI